MSELSEISIGQLAKGIRGVSYKPYQLKDDVNDGSFYLLRSNNIQNGKIDFSNIQIVDKSCVNENQKLKTGDIIVCMSNGSRQLVGKSALAENLEGDYCVGAFCSSFIVKDHNNPNFVFQVFQSEKFKQSIDLILSGSAINNLQNKQIEEVKLLLPAKLEEQTHIAEILSTADKAISQTETLIVKYQRIKTGLMQDLLTKGIDENGNIRSKATHKFVLKNGIELPQEWDLKSFKDVCSIIKDGTHLPPKRVDEGIWLLGVTNIIDGEWKNTKLDTMVPIEFYLQMHKDWRLMPGDVLLAIIGTIGKVTQVPCDFPKFTIHRNICLLRGKENDLSNDYLRLYIESSYFQRLLMNEANVTAQPAIFLNTIEKFQILKPSYKEQKLICEKINSAKKIIDNLRQNLKKLQSIKTGLMQDLLSGKVRVKVLNTTEEAINEKEVA